MISGYPPPMPVPPRPRSRIFYNRRGIRSGWRLLVWLGLTLGIVIALIIFIGIIIGVFLAVTGKGGGNPFLSLGKDFETLVGLGAEWFLFLAAFLAAVVVAVYIERREVRSLGLAFTHRWLKDFGLGFGLGVLMLSLVVLTLVGLGVYRIHGLNEGAGPALMWGVILGLGFLGVGLFEEFAFRGYLLQNLLDGLGLPAATIISCLVFAAVHTSNPGENPLGILEVLCAGILLLVPVLRTRALWMAVGLHAAWDWSQNFLYNVPDSGQVLPGGLLRTEIHGPAWLTGGNAGPEGSVVGLVVTALAALYLSRARWIRPDPEAACLWDRYVLHKEEASVPPQVAPNAGMPFDLS
ncbi:MAG TPA: CPBP family intramembrane glutamic endopeptidase [Chthonomonadaceae bacterium]|nr:CPBP family intramembrane glutamic endopeptidase [Chthonomonadaceae bacterium]